MKLDPHAASNLPACYLVGLYVSIEKYETCGENLTVSYRPKNYMKNKELFLVFKLQGPANGPAKDG